MLLREILSNELARTRAHSIKRATRIRAGTMEKSTAYTRQAKRTHKSRGKYIELRAHLCGTASICVHDDTEAPSEHSAPIFMETQIELNGCNRVVRSFAVCLPFMLLGGYTDSDILHFSFVLYAIRITVV